jgi:hypothetical protein
MHITLRQQKELINKINNDEDFVIQHVKVLAKYVHHVKLPKEIIASTYFPHRIALIQSLGAGDDVVEQCTMAYTVVLLWLQQKHPALLTKMLQKVSTLIPATKQDEAMEALQTMAISILLNYSEAKGLSLYKYMAHSLWMKCRSMFKRFQVEKNMVLDTHDVSELGTMAGF